MAAESNGDAPECFSVIDFECTTRHFVPLLRQACCEVGEAAITLGAIVRLCEMRRAMATFASIGVIAEEAFIRKRNVQRHIDKLVRGGWLANNGRELLGTSGYRRRRTNTLALTEKTLDYRKHRGPFSVLPCWAIGYLPSWSQRAVYASVVSRHCLLETVEAGGIGEAYERDQMPMYQLVKETGLSEMSIRRAKRKLQREGLLLIEPACDNSGDFIRLNPDAMIPAKRIPTPPKAGNKMAPSQGMGNGRAGVGRTPPGTNGSDVAPKRGQLAPQAPRSLPAGNKMAPARSQSGADPCNKMAPTRYQSGAPLYAEPLVRKSLVRTVSQNTGGEAPSGATDSADHQDFVFFSASQAAAFAERLQTAGIVGATSRAQARQVGPHLRTRGGWQTERGGIGSFNRGRR